MAQQNFGGRILLSSGILEKNAFERGDYGVYRHRKRHRVIIRKQRGYFYVNIFNEDVMINYVDELLLLLRLGRHNDIIDNFITE